MSYIWMMGWSSVSTCSFTYTHIHKHIHTTYIFTYTSLFVYGLSATILGNCHCDSGITGSTCPLNSTEYPQTVSSNFNDIIDATTFPVIYGASLSTQCGVLSSGESLVFK